ncbi:MAG: hypothetical protein M1837_003324 [Sclerophora amabilis]|nr:MAG: hypothetical protein M1837_003324 [Sclerophora amabilis]
MNNLVQLYSYKRLPMTMQKIEPFMKNLKAFEGVMNTFVQAKPEVIALVWGTMKLVLTVPPLTDYEKLSMRYQDTFMMILEKLEQIGKIWPRFELFRSLFHGHHGVEEAIAEFYRNYIEFCSYIVMFLSRRPFYALLQLTWSKLEARFKDIVSKIEDCKNQLEAEANAANMEIDFVRHEELKSLILRRTINSTARVPYRYIPFPKNTRFFPRPSIMKEIEKCLAPNDSTAPKGLRSVLLHGLGGIGKTQLAMQYAYSHWEDYSVILWIGADSDQKLADGYLEAATSLGIMHGNDQIGAVAILKRWLVETAIKWLVIFDNADDPSLLPRHWPHSATGAILTTSRDSMLNTNLISGSCRVEALNKEEGSQMLLSMLSIEDTDQTTNGDVFAIADKLDGVPLYISQMAGFILKTQVSLPTFLTIYHERREELHRENTSLDHLQYPETMETVWRVSFAKISPDARSFLRICAFLDPDAIPEILFRDGGMVLGEDDAAWLKDLLKFNITVSSLLSHSLIRRNSSISTLSMHRQVQLRALHDLCASNQAMFQVALSQVVQLLFAVFPRQSPLGEPIPNWPMCELYSKHVLHLYKTLCGEARFSADPRISMLLTELFCDCGVYLWARGLYTNAECLAKKSIEIGDSVLQADDCLRAQPYTLLGCIYLRTENKLQNAIECLNTALQIREESVRARYANQDPPREVDIQLSNAYSNLGIAFKQSGQYDRAAELHMRSLSIKQKYPKDSIAFLYALSYHNLGKLRRLQGRYKDAAKFFREGIELMTSSHDEMLHRKATFIYSLGDTEASQENIEDAKYFLMEALRIQKESVGEAIDTGLTCHRLGVVTYDQGEFDKALLLLKNAVDIFSQQHLLSKAKLARSLWWLSLVHRRLQQQSEADRLEDDAARLFLDITGKAISTDKDTKRRQYEEIVSDD